MSAVNQATVKAIISGDTIVLIGKASATGPPQEITVTLASIQAPKISRGPQQALEEPFAFESREFLRKLCVGKPVVFRIIYVLTANNKSSASKYFGDVDLVDSANGTTMSLAKAVVSAGWATVKNSREDQNSSIHDELAQLETAAKDAFVGMYTKDPKLKAASIRKLNWAPTATDIKNIFTQFQNKPTKAIIEYVRDGASFRVYIVETQTYVSFSLGGVLAPRINSSSKEEIDGDEEGVNKNKAAAEPFAFQSRHFSEIRLLCRDVDIVMESLDSKTSLILGSILHPRGDIAVEIVRNGLARVAERSITTLRKEQALALLQAEQESKFNRRFIWESVQDSQSAPISNNRVIVGVCVEVMSGDTLVVLPCPIDTDPSLAVLTTEEIKVCLSSIRAPKLGSKGSRGGEGSQPFAQESREFLRSRLIGKRVAITVDYEKYLQIGKTETKPVKEAEIVADEDEDGDAVIAEATDVQKPSAVLRIYGTVRLQSGPNSSSARSVGLQLVAEGLAVCTRRREERSAEYEALQIAEAEASVKAKGVHSECASAEDNHDVSNKINDVTTDGKRAKSLFGLLPKGPVKGLIEYVFTGSRFKVSIPSEACLVQLSLAQVRCPLAARSAPGQSARAAEPFSDEARRFSRLMLNQRQVEVIFDDIDKNGVMLGRIYTLGEDGNKQKKVPYALTLLSVGLARLDKFAFDRGVDTESIRHLQEAQDLAKDAKMGLWSVFIEPVDEGGDIGATEQQEASEALSGGLDGSKSSGLKWALGSVITVQLSEIVDGATFYVHEEDLLGAVSAVTEELTTYAASAQSGINPADLKKGQLVAAVFSEPPKEDGTVLKYWCRASVDEVVGNEANVTFIDYGNKSIIPINQLVSLHAASQPLQKTLPLARACKLAFIRPPPLVSEGTSDEWYAPLGRLAGCLLHELAWGRIMKIRVLGLEYERSDSRGSGRNRSSLIPSITHVALYPEKYEPEELTASPEFPSINANSLEAAVTSSKELHTEVLSINEEILSEGLATVSSKAARAVRKGARRGSTVTLFVSPITTIFLDKLESAQRLASKDHVNLFRYGDPGGDSDDDFGEDGSYQVRGEKAGPGGKDKEAKGAKDAKNGKHASIASGKSAK